MRASFFTLALCALAACTPAPAPTPAVETEAELVAHGEYIVTRVAFCGDCHTPFLESGEPDTARAFQGGPTGLPPPLAEYAPALAGIPGHFTEEEFAQVLITGLRPNGSTPRAPMPPYRLSERDARAVAAYIKTIPAAAE